MALHGALFLYVTSMSFALLYGGFRKSLLFRLCVAFMAAGFALQTAHMAYRWVETGIIPATDLNEICSATAWALVGIYLLFGVLLRSRIIVFFQMPVVALFLFAAVLIPEVPKQPRPFYYTVWFDVHILLLISGIGLFLFSFLYSSIFIMQDHSLRRRRQPISLSLPSLEESGAWATRLLCLGYGLYTAGLASSALYGVFHASRDEWHPGLLEAASVVVWLILGSAIVGWITAKVNPRRRAWLVVAGAASTLLIILGILWH